MKSIIFLVGVFICGSSFASVTPNGVPKNLHVYSAGGSTFVDLVSHDCSGSRYYIKNDHIRYDTIVSIILAAQLSKNQVQLRISGCNANNQGEIIGVYLK